jgi:hypothetical protein
MVCGSDVVWLGLGLGLHGVRIRCGMVRVRVSVTWCADQMWFMLLFLPCLYMGHTTSGSAIIN